MPTPRRANIFRSGRRCFWVASVGGLVQFARRGEAAAPAAGGLGVELGPLIPTAGTRKQAANGKPNYRNSADRSELVGSTSVGGLVHSPARSPDSRSGSARQRSRSNGVSGFRRRPSNPGFTRRALKVIREDRSKGFHVVRVMVRFPPQLVTQKPPRVDTYRRIRATKAKNTSDFGMFRA